MSGRFTFTAGNTLTAAQLNTNVMDGIPFKINANVTTSFTGSLAVTWPAAFTSGVVPVVTATVVSGNNTATSVTMSTPTNTGITFYAWTGSTAASTAKIVHYTALQMTSTTGPGNS
jgi:hypothetical protein